jgi:hypothetical protein
MELVSAAFGLVQNFMAKMDEGLNNEQLYPDGRIS